MRYMDLREYWVLVLSPPVPQVCLLEHPSAIADDGVQSHHQSSKEASTSECFWRPSLSAVVMFAFRYTGEPDPLVAWMGFFDCALHVYARVLGACAKSPSPQVCLLEHPGAIADD